MASVRRCCICLVDMEEREEVVVLRPCAHSSFHPSCIQHSLDECGDRCPLCRSPVLEFHWEIEAVVGHRSAKKRPREFEVRWKGFDTTDWVEEGELRKSARTVLRQYERERMNMVDLVEEEAREQVVVVEE